MPFPVQRVQTDRGGEFFAHEVQGELRERRIKFRPNRPRAPHLNGKVERVQRTALEEFWPTVDPKAPDLATRLEEWRTFYNHHRPPARRPRRRHARRADRAAGGDDPRPRGRPRRLRPEQGAHPLAEHPLPLAPNQRACGLINADPTLPACKPVVPVPWTAPP